ncbi:MAG: SGNH/GDSL hydrolase family protein [Anaerolineae bacterium]|nr:SGNH/GDSL hydrolase family protein [Anaerolineae bacterium]
MTTLIQDNALVLFQGDSITDSGRSRQDTNHLGDGYALITAGWFSALYPQKKVSFLNRGISGNRVPDLIGRWQQDYLDLKPTWLSILIGVNDMWRRYDSNDPTTTGEYESNYRRLLDLTRERLTPQIILCEPFLLPINEQQKSWREDLDPKIEVVQRLARDYKTLLVPLDSIFAEASQQREASYWLPDGVHTSPAGAALIAQSWLKTVGAL